MKKKEKGGAKSERWHLLAQALLFVGIFLAINYLALRLPYKHDMSSGGKFTLSAATRKLAKKLPKDSEIFAFFSRGHYLYEDTRALLESLDDTGKRLDCKLVDPFKELGKAGRLAAKYELNMRDGIMLIKAGERRKVLSAIDFIDDPLNYRETGSLGSFRGEEAIYKTLLELSEDVAPNVMVLSGNGGDSLKPSYDLLEDYLRNQNVKLGKLSLAAGEEIDPELDLIMLIGPNLDLNSEQIRKIEKHWLDNSASLFVMLNADARTPRLHKFLKKYGVEIGGDYLVKASVSLNERKLSTISYSPSVVFTAADCVPVELVGERVTLAPKSTSLKILSKGDILRAKNLIVTPLLVVDDMSFWGERDRAQEIPIFDKGIDTAPPFVVGALAEIGKLADSKIKSKNPKLLVLGNDKFANPNARPQSQANFDFVIGSINCLLERDYATGVTPKKYQRFTASIEASQLRALIFMSCIIALAAIMTGLLIRSIRKE